jgi:DNA polymerase-3 subunit gamma/tau
MSYQVLARKYRPQNFDEVVGQEHVTTTLKNAVLKNRLHHAYLFTGVRGTGKTSLARIFAKMLDCEKGPTPTPCNQCSSCLSITRGNFLDVIEIDAASNTGVDSVRELREQVKYMPAVARYKIYIIDEVHMLSTSAFNALLKTLEEPPAHVLFLFATTEAQKLPVTILSRCQRFDLRRLAQAQIKTRLEVICQKEGVGCDAISLDLLARSAEGSMRDAQSLLDMAIGLCGDSLQSKKIQEMLGLTEATWIQDLTSDCLNGRLQEALSKVQEIYNRGFDLRQIAMQWVAYLHDLALLKAAGEKALDAEISPDQLTIMKNSVSDVVLDALQIAFQTVYRSAEEIFRSESPKILFDLLLVKLVHGAPYQSLSSVLAEEPKASARSHEPQREMAAQSQPEKKITSPEPTVSSTNLLSTPSKISAEAGEDMIRRALKKHPQISALLEHALSKTWEGSNYVVVFERDSIYLEMFSEKRQTFAENLSQELGAKISVQVKQGEAQTSSSINLKTEAALPPLPADPIVRQAVEILNATVQEVKGSSN